MLRKYFLLIPLLSTPLFADGDKTHLALGEVFKGSPFIYTILGTLSLLAFVVWLYSFLTLKLSQVMPQSFLIDVKKEIENRKFEQALRICEREHHFTASIVASGIASRKHGHHVMMGSDASGRKTVWRLSLATYLSFK